MSSNDWVDDPQPNNDGWVDDPQPNNDNHILSLEGLKQGFLDVPKNIVKGLGYVDEYTGAPIRKFVTETVTGNKMDHAPTGEEQARMMGFTNKSYKDAYGIPGYLGGRLSPSDVMGFSLDMVQDPLLLGSALVKGGKSLVKGAGELFRGGEIVNTEGGRTAAKLAQEQAAGAAAMGNAKSTAIAGGGGTTVENSGKLFSVKSPETLEELRNWKAPDGAGAMPGKERLKQISEIVPDLETKPLNYHYEMMDNPKAMKEMKLKFENLPTEDAKKIAVYNQTMLDEAANKTIETASAISKESPKSIPDAGLDFIDNVKNVYNNEKQALGPVFEEFKNSPPLDSAQTQNLALAMSQDSKIGKLLKQNDQGSLFLEKNSPRTGISDSEHKILSSVIDDLNQGMTFKEIQETREYLRKAIDPTNPAATSELSKVRSIMLDKLEEMASANPNVRDTFKAYAKNERAKENIEKIIGGKIESLDAMFSANPDKVVQKIISNPNYMQVVGDYIGKDKLDNIVSAFVNNGVQKAIDTTGSFSPSKLKNWLKSNDVFLSRNLPQDTLNRLQALADHGYYAKRFLDEVNPSGTAASILNGIKPEGFISRVTSKNPFSAVTSEVSNAVGSAVKQRQALNFLNESLGGQKIVPKSSYMDSLNPLVAKYLNNKIVNQTAVNATRDYGTPYFLKPNNQIENEKNNKDNIMNKVKGTKYQQVLEQASQKGGHSMAAANYILQQRDPEYRKVIEGE